MIIRISKSHHFGYKVEQDCEFQWYFCEFQWCCEFFSSGVVCEFQWCGEFFNSAGTLVNSSGVVNSLTAGHFCEFQWCCKFFSGGVVV
jgi:hypothetical protein